MFTLNSDRLSVEIMEPGEGTNRGFRFDRAGYISEVVLDGDMRFAATEPRNLAHPSSLGRGFCNEYRFDPSGEAAIGDYFPKFGIGIIQKEDEGKFVFHKAYRNFRENAVAITKSKDAARFITEPMPCLGYAVRLTKEIRVSGNTMSMDVTVENVGEKPITMNEFCHNFISIDGMAVGSDYELDLPQCPDLGHERLNNRRGFSGVLRGNGRGLTFCEFTAIDTDYAVQGADMEQTVPFTWTLRHKGARGMVAGRDYFIPKFIAVWAVDHIVSPEVVHEFTVEPGAAHSWKREWTFDTF